MAWLWDALNDPRVFRFCRQDLVVRADSKKVGLLETVFHQESHLFQEFFRIQVFMQDLVFVYVFRLVHPAVLPFEGTDDRLGVGNALFSPVAQHQPDEAVLFEDLPGQVQDLFHSSVSLAFGFSSSPPLAFRSSSSRKSCSLSDRALISARSIPAVSMGG